MSMRQALHALTITTAGRGLFEITAPVVRWVADQQISRGLLTLFIPHTSASLLIQENADPDVRTDLLAYFDRIAPENSRAYVHTMEGPDDMPAHLRAALTQTSLSVPVEGGRPVLGTLAGDLRLRAPPLPAPAAGRAASAGGVGEPAAHGFGKERTISPAKPLP